MTKSLNVITSNIGHIHIAMASSALAIATVISAPAMAQTTPAPAATPAPQADDDTRLGDIVITARKRAESIDTAPLSITAMTAAKVEERGLKSLEDVASFTPGFYTQSVTGTGTGRNDRSFRQLTFRGIGANSTNVGPFAGGVAFLDGAPVLNSSLSNVQDVERVEVLKGPQSVYFGRSTFIGAVNYVTKDPATDRWTARLTSEYAFNDLTDLSASISGPLTDWAAIRISGRHFAKGGQYKTANTPIRDLGGQSTNSVSATLLLTPAKGLRIKLFYNRFEDKDAPPAQYSLGGRNIGFGGSNCNLGGTYGAYICGDVPQRADPALISANLTPTPALIAGLLGNSRNFPIPFNYADYLSDYGLARHANQASGRIDYTFGDDGPTFTAMTAYHDEHIVTLSDFNFRATPLVVSTSVGYRDYDWSQEVRLVSSQKNRFRWALGGNYVKLKQSTSGIIGQFASFGVLNFGQAQVGYTQAETPAVFGGAYFDIVPQLTLSLEGRYQWDKISGHYATSATAFADVSQTFKSFSPRVSLDYKLTPNSTIYALFSRGYKPGGFNQGILTQAPFVLAQFASTGAASVYGQERLDNYETGIKGSFLDGRVRFALDGYIGKYRDAQIPIPVIYYTTQNADGSPNTGGPSNSAILTRNIGSVDLKGVEFEAEAIVVPGLRIGGTFAYTDTKIKSYYCAECSQIFAQTGNTPAGTPIPQGPSTAPQSVNYTKSVGNRLPGAPRFTYTLSANYDAKVSSTLTAYIGADYIYRGRYFADAANVASSGSSEIVNARIGVRSGRFGVEIFARNLFDNQSPTITYYPSDFFTSPTLAVTTGNTLRLGLPDKRRVGVRANVTF